MKKLYVVRHCQAEGQAADAPLTRGGGPAIACACGISVRQRDRPYGFEHLSQSL
ncbi:hypothetical protein PVOR_07690 [Paenibacillus vortex V453]|uniref:Phosphoglycerate mutase n=1 Tax=Paenibacillus vortex V453 TaxID=715225 RepID=A0A2R9SZF8_9BACL|nr:hypothetical protein PVOR_07690 [Paenibacillus vortex V453]